MPTGGALRAIAGALRKTSALLKLAEGHPLALAHASYIPEGQDAERMVAEVGRAHGLRVPPAVAARVAEACGNDQAIVAQEIAKLALYVGASPEAPKELDHEAVDAVGAHLHQRAAHRDAAGQTTAHFAGLILQRRQQVRPRQPHCRP